MAKPKTLTKKQRLRWGRYVAALRKTHPTNPPVKIKTVPLKGVHGEAWQEGGEVFISINANSEYGYRVDALAHEYAHCLNRLYGRRNHPSLNEHDETWGVWYAKCFQVIDAEIAAMGREYWTPKEWAEK